MLERANVDSLMAGPLGDWLAEQAAVRDAAREKTNRRRIIVLVLVAALVLLMMAFSGEDFGGAVPIGMILGALGFAWAQVPVSRAVKTVKVGINDAIAGALGLSYSHDSEAGTPFELAKSCKLLPVHDRARFEDEWSGQFGDIPFRLHEARLEQRRGSGKDRRWVTVFEGLIMSIGYKRRFHGTTLLVRDNAHRGAFFRKKDSITVDGMQLDYAEMTHPDFEDRFDIYTTDQVEARHLIDPLYVERLIAVEESYRGEDVATIFHEGSLVVTLKTGKMFESGSIHAKDDRQRIAQTVAQFERIAQLARQLNSREPLTGR